MEGIRIKVRTRPKARIEIIPLIDVIFFLLATFVLFTLSLNRIQSVDVNLPVSTITPGTPPLPKDMLTIQISDQGNLYFNRELIDIDEFAARLDQWKQQAQDPRVLVAGDEKAKWGVTVKVLDEVRNAHIEKISMETRVRQTGR